jgi:hypothetical protein
MTSLFSGNIEERLKLTLRASDALQCEIVSNVLNNIILEIESSSERVRKSSRGLPTPLSTHISYRFAVLQDDDVAWQAIVKD